MESSRADARLSREEWEEFFQTHMKEALEEVGYEPHRVFNFDETRFLRNFLTTYGGRQVWCRKSTKCASRRRGYTRTHITMNCCISAAGHTVPPLFCWETKKTKGEWTKQEQCKTYHNGTGNGWSLAKVFKDWLLKVFVKHVDPKGKGGVVLFLNGSPPI